MQPLVTSKKTHTFCKLYSLKDLLFLLLLIAGFKIQAQPINSNQDIKIDVQTFKVSPDSPVNLTKYSDILIDLRKSLEVILSEEGYFIQPILAELETKKNSNGSFIKIKGDLILPDPSFQKNNYSLVLEGITYEDGNLLGKKSIKINLFKEIRNFEKHLRKDKLNILRLLPTKKTGSLDIKGEKINDPYIQDILKQVHEMKKEGYIDLFDSESCNILPLKKTKEEEGTSLVEMSTRIKSKDSDGYDIFYFKDGAYKIIYSRDHYFSLQHRMNEDNPYLSPRGSFLCKKENDIEYTTQLYSPIVIQGKNLDLNSIFWDEFFRKKNSRDDYYRNKRKTTKKYNILLLPFMNDDTTSCTSCTDAVAEFLRDEIALEEDVNIDYKFNNQFNISEPLEYETAKLISEHTKADLVVWGYYKEEHGTQAPYMKVNFFTPKKNTNSTSIKHQGATKYQKAKFISSLIFENKDMSQNIKDIVYLSIGMSTLNCQKRENLFNKLSLSKKSPQYVEIINKLIGCETSINYEKVNKKKVLNLFEIGAQLDSNNINLLYAQYAFYSRKNQNYSKSIKFLEKIREIDPHSMSLVRLSKHYKRTNQPQKALDVLDDVFHNMDENSNSKPYYLYHRGLILEELDRIPDAINSYQNVISIDPRSMWADDSNNQLGKLYAKEKDFKKAEEIYDAAIKMEIPDRENRYLHYPQTILDKIHFLRYLKKDTLGVINEYNYLKRTVIDSGERERYFTESMRYLIQVKKFDLALSDCDTLVKYFPNEKKYKTTRYKILLNKNAYKDGITYLDDLLKKHQWKEFRLERGAVKMIEEKNPESASDFHYLISQDTLVCQSASFLASYYAQSESYNEDSLNYYINKLVDYHPYTYKKSSKIDTSKFKYSKLNRALNPRPIARYYHVDKKIFLTAYNSYIDKNFSSLFPKESKFFGQTYYTLKSRELNKLEKDSIYEEGIILIKKLQEDRGRFKIHETQKNNLNKQLASFYISNHQNILAIASLDDWLQSSLKNKNVTSSNFSYNLEWVKNNKPHEPLKKNSKFQKMIKKYEKKLKKLEKKEAKKK